MGRASYLLVQSGYLRGAITLPKSMETPVEEIERLYRELCSNRDRIGDTA
jgi:hypothetical protein